MTLTEPCREALTPFARDVYDGLSQTPQRRLPSQYLYDAAGSALFEAITHLPEYGLTRADERLLNAYAQDLVDLFDAMPLVVELGSGTGRKTRPLLQAFAGRGPLQYCPVDVSPTALAQCASELKGIAHCTPMVGEFLPQLTCAAACRQPGQPLLVLFLGSTIGNFNGDDALEFLRAVQMRLTPGDCLLLGADLVKPIERLLLAYDDPAGVTAAFNRNLLGRINRELGGNFDLRQFAHEVRYDAQEQRVEMHLRSQRSQRVEIAACDLQFSLSAGETIWTESSHKYHPRELLRMAVAAGFSPRAQWTDEEWLFSENLWQVTPDQQA